MSAAEAIARAEAAGVRLRLRPNGVVRMEAAAPPPADVLADLRRWREDVARLLAARDGQPECGPVPPRQHDAAEAARPADPATLPPAWLAAMRRRAEAGRARVERHCGIDVAVFEPLAGEPDGAPGTVASALPAAIRIAEAAAERAALPADAGPHLRDEAAECEAILRQSNWRPPAWAEAEEAPRPGDRCGCCKCGWWWRPARPRTDGLAPGPGWRCAVCRPAPPGCETAEVRT